MLIVDDHALVREAVREMLQREFPAARILTAGDAAGGLRLACTAQLDLVVMDLNLPDSSGIEAARRIKDMQHAVKVVIFTMSHRRPDRMAAIAYADAYVTKDQPPELLIATIRRLLAGRR